MTPGWSRLWLHSYRLGFRWLLRGLFRGWGGWRVGVARLLIPLDPWRYYELGRVADEQFQGLNLDVSSPKLLASLLRHERCGNWLGIDRDEREVAAWGRVDPALSLAVCDATCLPFPAAAFDNCVCLSVVEHIPGDGDALAMGEMWRVLKPGGVLHVTTNVAVRPRDVYISHKIYGEGSVNAGGRVFFERHYTPPQVTERLLREPWEVLEAEYACQVEQSVESLFYALRPWSYTLGWALRWVCAMNVRVSRSPAILSEFGHGVVYLKLRKPSESSCTAPPGGSSAPTSTRAEASASVRDEYENLAPDPPPTDR